MRSKAMKETIRIMKRSIRSRFQATAGAPPQAEDAGTASVLEAANKKRDSARGLRLLRNRLLIAVLSVAALTGFGFGVRAYTRATGKTGTKGSAVASFQRTGSGVNDNPNFPLFDTLKFPLPPASVMCLDMT